MKKILTKEEKARLIIKMEEDYHSGVSIGEGLNKAFANISEEDYKLIFQEEVKMQGVAKIYELKKQGLTFQEIADSLQNITKYTVRNWLIQYCEENNLEIPKVKAGRKKKKINFK